MTDLLLKNRKLLNGVIIEFSYNNNEIFSSEVKDLITSFINNYNNREIVLDDKKDKKILDKFFKEKEINKNKCKYLIKDFITLLEYLNDLKAEKKDTYITEESNISKVLELLKDNVSKDFSTIFKNKKNDISIKKAVEIFKYFLQSIFKYVKEEIKIYQEEIEDEMEDLDDEVKKELEEKKLKLDEYYNKEPLITKQDLSFALQLFMTLVLFREKDKNNKIKLNTHNIINYLQEPDFWDNKIYQNEKFHKNLYELHHYIYNYFLCIHFLNYKKYKKILDKL